MSVQRSATKPASPLIVGRAQREMPTRKGTHAEPNTRRMVGYVRVSTTEQGQSGAGLEAQRLAIASECRRRGWELVAIHEDVLSGKTMNGRRGLSAAIVAVEAGAASGIVVSKVDRLSRSLADFANLMKRAQETGWAIVALDSNVDTTTPVGEAMVNVIATFAQLERRMIGLRTKEAMAVKKSQGARFGRPRSLAPETASRVKILRKSGMTLPAIAELLNAEGVPTAAGGKQWHTTGVRRALLA